MSLKMSSKYAQKEFGVAIIVIPKASEKCAFCPAKKKLSI